MGSRGDDPHAALQGELLVRHPLLLRPRNEARQTGQRGDRLVDGPAAQLVCLSPERPAILDDAQPRAAEHADAPARNPLSQGLQEPELTEDVQLHLGDEKLRSFQSETGRHVAETHR